MSVMDYPRCQFEHPNGMGCFMDPKTHSHAVPPSRRESVCYDCQEVCERCGHTAAEHDKGGPCLWSADPKRPLDSLICPCRHMILDGEPFVHG